LKIEEVEKDKIQLTQEEFKKNELKVSQEKIL